MLILSAHLKKKLKKDSLFVQNKGNISPALLPRFFVGKKKDKTNATKIKATKKISMDTKTNRDVQIHTHKHPPTNPHTHTHTHTRTQWNIRIKKQSNLHKNKFSINRFDCLFTINKIYESDSDRNK